MPRPAKPPKADPLADRPDIPKSEVRYNTDATIRLVLTGQIIWLRPPTVGELEDLVLARNVIAEQVVELQATINEINEATLTWTQDAAEAIKAEKPVPSQPTNRAGEANRLVTQQRRIYATFWAEKIIPLLTMKPDVEVKADDMPAFMGTGTALGNAFEAWNAGPSVPGDG